MKPTYRTVQGSVSALGHKELSSEGANQNLVDAVVKAQTENKKLKEEIKDLNDQITVLRKEITKYESDESEAIKALKNENLILQAKLDAYKKADKNYSQIHIQIPETHTEIGDRPDTYYGAKEGTTYDINTKPVKVMSAEVYDKVKDMIDSAIAQYIKPQEMVPYCCDIDDEYHFSNEVLITKYPDDDTLVEYDLLERGKLFSNLKNSILGKDEE